MGTSRCAEQSIPALYMRKLNIEQERKKEKDKGKEPLIGARALRVALAPERKQTNRRSRRSH